jgi:hypothetical protein
MAQQNIYYPTNTYENHKSQDPHITIKQLYNTTISSDTNISKIKQIWQTITDFYVSNIIILPDLTRLLDNCISFGIYNLNNKPYRVYRKIKFNKDPEFNIKQYEQAIVISDHNLPGGTKQRAIIEALKDVPNQEFVYCGPHTGLAQVALSIAGWYYKKQVTIFTTGSNLLTARAKMFGANYILGTNLKDLYPESQQYCKAHNCYELEFGANNPVFKQILTSKLAELPKLISKYNKDYQQLPFYVCHGSGVLYESLRQVFPANHFYLLQVGKVVKQEYPNSTIIVSDLKFYQKATQLPPYPSIDEYDAKLWKYIDQKKQCIVLNVGSYLNPDFILGPHI